MKRKITLLTGLVLFVILCVVDAFTFLTLDAHLRSVAYADLENRVQSMAQAAADHFQDRSAKDRSISPGRWMDKYAGVHDAAYLIAPDGQLTAAVGGLKLPFASLPPTVKWAGPSVATVKAGGHTYYLAQAPVVDEDDGGSLGSVAIVEIPTIRTDDMQELLALLVIGSIGALFLTLAGSYLVALTSMRPLRRMVRQVEEIEASQLERRMTVPATRDEVEQLARAFNRMLERIERSWKQQGRFVADASHEIRTPLTVIQGYANLLARWGKTDPKVLDEAISVIREESARLHALTEDLLLLARSEAVQQSDRQQGEFDICDAAEIMREAVSVVSPLYPQVPIEMHLAPGQVQFAPRHLKRVFINILDNACKYGGQSVRVVSACEGSQWIVDVRDNGRGIPQDDLPHVFDRFYRVDKSRQRGAGGTGLGLALVQELVTSYGGEVAISSQLGEGTTVTVRLRLDDTP
ncbi:MAG: HAMP domain-containing histidine kinase [Alicyclobacillus sp.]|nr:HAMP domain-containing histidine kinase [Alicyclobacillus sp.]